MLVLHLDLLHALSTVFQIHLDALVVILEPLDLFLVHGLARISHLELHLQLVTLLLGFIDLFIEFDDHLGMQAIGNFLSLLSFNISVLALLLGRFLLSELLLELLVLFNQIVIGFNELLKPSLGFIFAILTNDGLHGAI